MEGPIAHQLMAQDTIALIDRMVGGPVRLVRYSDGAVVALGQALTAPTSSASWCTSAA